MFETIKSGRPVTVIVEPRRTHPRTKIYDASLFRDITEASIRVPVEVLAPKVVGDVEVGPTVFVVIAPRSREAETVVVVVDATLCRNIFEVTWALIQTIAEQEVRWAVLRVVVRRRVAVLSFTLEIDVAAEVEVNSAIAVVVGRGNACERTLRSGCEVERVWHWGKVPLPVIEKEQWPAGSNQNKILEAGISQIDKQRACRFIENIQTRLFRNLAKASTLLDLVKTVWQPARLADVDLVASVTVDVRGRNSVLAVLVDARGGVQARAPVRNAARQLLRKR